MTRRKGERTIRQTEREYPFRVLIEVPAGGLGNAVFDIGRLCRLLGVPEMAGRGERVADRDYVAYCFAEKAVAEEFARRFGAISEPPICRS